MTTHSSGNGGLFVVGFISSAQRLHTLWGVGSGIYIKWYDHYIIEYVVLFDCFYCTAYIVYNCHYLHYFSLAFALLCRCLHMYQGWKVVVFYIFYSIIIISQLN